MSVYFIYSWKDISDGPILPRHELPLCCIYPIDDHLGLEQTKGPTFKHIPAAGEECNMFQTWSVLGLLLT